MAGVKSRSKKEAGIASSIHRKKLDELVKELLRTERIGDAKFVQAMVERLDFTSKIQ